MNLTTARQTTLDWLIKLSKEPGWKNHAWHRAKELDKDQSGLYCGIANELKNAMLELKQGQKKAGGSSESLPSVR